MEERPKRKGPPPLWHLEHQIRDEGTRLVVQILKDKNSKFPRYSVQLGKDIGQEDRIGFRIPVMLDIKDGSVSLRSDQSIVIGNLYAEAQRWVEAEASRLEAEYQRQRTEDRIARRQPRQEIMRKGKTARKRNRRFEQRAS